MADFNISLAITLPLEGGYVFDKKDPGGETNRGITMLTFQRYAHPLLGIEPTSENLKAITVGQAAIIYKARYWNVIRGDDFKFQPLANNVFDFFVNSGTHSTSLLQNVINAMGARPPLIVDGGVGQGTLDLLHTLPQPEVYAKFRQGRIDYYNALGPKFATFSKGLIKRANVFAELPAEPGDTTSFLGPNMKTASVLKPPTGAIKKK